MCLVAFALDAHPRCRLVLAGNRDESFDRPSAPLAVWPDAPHVIAGRDLVAGGTWLGVTKEGRWAVLTNVRDPQHPRPSIRSRGALPADYLAGSLGALEYAQLVASQRDECDGFNLIVGDDRQTAAVSTRGDAVTVLGPGVYGISNDRLDTPWPKLVRARTGLRAALSGDEIDRDALMDLMDDRTVSPDAALPDTGVGLEWERALSPARIVTPGYGTRVTTVLTLDRDGGGEITERTWQPHGSRGRTVTAPLNGRPAPLADDASGELSREAPP